MRRRSDRISPTRTGGLDAMPAALRRQLQQHQLLLGTPTAAHSDPSVNPLSSGSFGTPGSRRPHRVDTPPPGRSDAHKAANVKPVERLSMTPPASRGRIQQFLMSQQGDVGNLRRMISRPVTSPLSKASSAHETLGSVADMQKQIAAEMSWLKMEFKSVKEQSQRRGHDSDSNRVSPVPPQTNAEDKELLQDMQDELSTMRVRLQVAATRERKKMEEEKEEIRREAGRAAEEERKKAYSIELARQEASGEAGELRAELSTLQKRLLDAQELAQRRDTDAKRAADERAEAVADAEQAAADAKREVHHILGVADERDHQRERELAEVRAMHSEAVLALREELGRTRGKLSAQQLRAEQAEDALQSARRDVESLRRHAVHAARDGREQPRERDTFRRGFELAQQELRDVRQSKAATEAALTDAHEKLGELAAAAAQAEGLRKALAAREKQAEERGEAAAAAEQRAAESDARAEQCRLRLSQALDEMELLRSASEAARERAMQSDDDAAQAKASAQRADAKLRDARAALEAATADLHAAKVSAATADGARKSTTSRCDDLAKQLQQAIRDRDSAELAAVKGGDLSAKLTADLTEAQRLLSEMQRQCDDAHASRSALSEELQHSRASEAQLRKRLGESESRAAAQRDGRVTAALAAMPCSLRLHRDFLQALRRNVARKKRRRHAVAVSQRLSRAAFGGTAAVLFAKWKLHSCEARSGRRLAKYRQELSTSIDELEAMKLRANDAEGTIAQMEALRELTNEQLKDLERLQAHQQSELVGRRATERELAEVRGRVGELESELTASASMCTLLRHHCRHCITPALAAAHARRLAHTYYHRIARHSVLKRTRHAQAVAVRGLERASLAKLRQRGYYALLSSREAGRRRAAEAAAEAAAAAAEEADDALRQRVASLAEVQCAKEDAEDQLCGLQYLRDMHGELQKEYQALQLSTEEQRRDAGAVADDAVQRRQRQVKRSAAALRATTRIRALWRGWARWMWVVEVRRRERAEGEVGAAGKHEAEAREAQGVAEMRAAEVEQALLDEAARVTEAEAALAAAETLARGIEEEKYAVALQRDEALSAKRRARVRAVAALAASAQRTLRRAVFAALSRGGERRMRAALAADASNRTAECAAALERSAQSLAREAEADSHLVDASHAAALKDRQLRALQSHLAAVQARLAETRALSELRQRAGAVLLQSARSRARLAGVFSRFLRLIGRRRCARLQVEVHAARMDAALSGQASAVEAAALRNQVADAASVATDHGADVQRMAALLAAKESEAAVVAAELLSEREQAHDLRRQHRERGDRVRELEREVSALAVDREAQEGVAAGLAADVQRLQREVGARRDDCAREHAARAAADSEAARLGEELAAVAAEAKRLRLEADGRDAEAADARRASAAAAALLEDDAARLADLRARLEDKTAALERAESDLDEREARLAAAEQRCAASDAELRSRDRSAQQLCERLAAAERRAAEADAALESTARDLARAAAVADARAAEVARADRSRQEAAADAAHRAEELAAARKAQREVATQLQRANAALTRRKDHWLAHCGAIARSLASMRRRAAAAHDKALLHACFSILLVRPLRKYARAAAVPAAPLPHPPAVPANAGRLDEALARVAELERRLEAAAEEAAKLRYEGDVLQAASASAASARLHRGRAAKAAALERCNAGRLRQRCWGQLRRLADAESVRRACAAEGSDVTAELHRCQHQYEACRRLSEARRESIGAALQTATSLRAAACAWQRLRRHAAAGRRRVRARRAVAGLAAATRRAALRRWWDRLRAGVSGGRRRRRRAVAAASLAGGAARAARHVCWQRLLRNCVLSQQRSSFEVLHQGLTVAEQGVDAIGARLSKRCNALCYAVASRARRELLRRAFRAVLGFRARRRKAAAHRRSADALLCGSDRASRALVWARLCGHRQLRRCGRASDDARQSASQARDLAQQNERLSQQVAESIEELSAVQHSSSALMHTVSEMRVEVEALTEDRDHLLSQRAEMQAQVALTADQRDAAAAAVQQRDEELRKAERRAERAASRARSAQEEVPVLKDSVERLEAETKRLVDERERLEQVEADLKQQLSSVREEKDCLRADARSAEESAALRLSESRSELQRALEAAQEELRSLASRQQRTEDELDAARYQTEVAGHAARTEAAARWRSRQREQVELKARAARAALLLRYYALLAARRRERVLLRSASEDAAAVRRELAASEAAAAATESELRAAVDAARGDAAAAGARADSLSATVVEVRAECAALRQSVVDAQQLAEATKEDAEYRARVAMEAAESQGSLRRQRVTRDRLPGMEQASRVRLLRRHYSALHWYVRLGVAKAEVRAAKAAHADAETRFAGTEGKLARKLASRSRALAAAIEVNTRLGKSSALLVTMMRYRHVRLLRRQRELSAAAVLRGADRLRAARGIAALQRSSAGKRYRSLRVVSTAALAASAQRKVMARAWRKLGRYAVDGRSAAARDASQREADSRAASQQRQVDTLRQGRRRSVDAILGGVTRATLREYFGRLRWLRLSRRTRRKRQLRDSDSLRTQHWRLLAQRWWTALRANAAGRRKRRRREQVAAHLETVVDAGLMRRCWRTLVSHAACQRTLAAADRRQRAAVKERQEAAAESDRRQTAGEQKMKSLAESERRLQGRVDELSDSAASQREQITALQKERAELQRRLLLSEPRVEELSVELTQAREAKQVAEARVKRLQRNYDESSSSSSAAARELQVALDDKSAALAEIERDRASLAAQLQELSVKLEAEKGQRKTSEGDLVSTAAELAALRQSSEENQARLTAELSGCQAELRREQVRHADARDKLGFTERGADEKLEAAARKEKELEGKLSEASAREVDLDDHLRAATSTTQEMAEMVERVVGESAKRAKDLEARVEELADANAGLEGLCQSARDEARLSGERSSLLEGRLRESQTNAAALESDLHKMRAEQGPLLAAKDAAELRAQESRRELEESGQRLQAAEDELRLLKNKLAEAVEQGTRFERDAKAHRQKGYVSEDHLDEFRKRAEEAEEARDRVETELEAKCLSAATRAASAEASVRQLQEDSETLRSDLEDFKRRLQREQGKAVEGESVTSQLRQELRSCMDKLRNEERKAAGLTEQVRLARGRVRDLENLAEKTHDEVAGCENRAVVLEQEVVRARQELEELRPQALAAQTRAENLDKMLEDTLNEHRILAATSAASERRAEAAGRALASAERSLEFAEREREKAVQERQRALDMATAYEAAAACGGLLTLHTDPIQAERRRQSLAVMPRNNLTAVLDGALSETVCMGQTATDAEEETPGDAEALEVDQPPAYFARTFETGVTLRHQSGLSDPKD
eukprot:TRINITY_DN4672_c2_g1_i1.p1 TRINITY_DN4672_c2_g1~~TRINITY_DN4672_c2_g1_i1.p1  ORF type:complete len:3339 (+),score=1473.57 TRINITY_DN4672_c2_g1_i1:133-10149(+)